jgi:hypothetical protein
MICLVSGLILFSFENIEHVEVTLVLEVQKWFDDFQIVDHDSIRFQIVSKKDTKTSIHKKIP